MEPTSPEPAHSFKAPDSFVRDYMRMRDALRRILHASDVDNPELLYRGRGAESALARYVKLVSRLANDGLYSESHPDNQPTKEGKPDA